MRVFDARNVLWFDIFESERHHSCRSCSRSCGMPAQRRALSRIQMIKGAVFGEGHLRLLELGFPLPPNSATVRGVCLSFAGPLVSRWPMCFMISSPSKSNSLSQSLCNRLSLAPLLEVEGDSLSPSLSRYATPILFTSGGKMPFSWLLQLHQVTTPLGTLYVLYIFGRITKCECVFRDHSCSLYSYLYTHLRPLRSSLSTTTLLSPCAKPLPPKRLDHQSGLSRP